MIVIITNIVLGGLLSSVAKVIGLSYTPAVDTHDFIARTSHQHGSQMIELEKEVSWLAKNLNNPTIQKEEGRLRIKEMSFKYIGNKLVNVAPAKVWTKIASCPSWSSAGLVPALRANFFIANTSNLLVLIKISLSSSNILSILTIFIN